MKHIFISAVLLFATTRLLTAEAAISGNWKVHNSISGSESDQDCTLSQNGKELTGTCKGENGEVKLMGSVDGNKINWKYDSEYNGTPLTLTYAGTLDDSGAIKGDVNVDPFGVSGDFTATPVKSESTTQK
jgi:hypothetical protein